MTTDWLASKSVFYNTETGKISTNINEVIDFDSFEWHIEGVYNYADFGYSVLEQTPIKNIKFLRHSSSIRKNENGKIEVTYLNDSAEKWVDKTSHTDDVLQILKKNINNWENQTKGEIIIPTSGGYDSRLLNFMINDKSRIRAFTYGGSDLQHKSYEIVLAKKLAQILQIKWQQIDLGYYNQYLDKWYEKYGVSTHAHGMYHIEFYTKISEYVNGNNPLLSGLIGDAWAGSVQISNINTSTEILKLGYSHDLNMDASQIINKPKEFELRENYFSKNKEKVKSDFWKVIESMRFKMTLLNYLLQIPRTFGFEPYAPFINEEVALSMLTLPSEKRKNRVWQTDFFRQNGLDLEHMNLKATYQNSLNYQSELLIPLVPLDVSLLREIVKPSYVEWINKSIFNENNFSIKAIKRYDILRDKPILWRFIPKKYKFGKTAYNAYLTLYPLQKIIQQRNKYFEK